MSARTIGELACRILGVYLWCQGLSVLSVFLRVGMSLAEEGAAAAWVVAGFGVGGAVLFWGGSRIARALPGPEEEPEGTARVAAIAFSVLGLWIVATRIPTVARHGLALWITEDEFRSPAGTVVLFVTEVVVVLFGAGLFLQAAGLSWVWRRALAPRSSGEALPPGRSHDLQAIAFSAVALYLVLDGLIQLLDAGTILLTRPELFRGASGSWMDSWAGRELVTSTTMFAAGAFLFAWSRRVSAFWNRLQGTPPAGELA